MKVAYCPYCNTEISVKSYEAVTSHVYWDTCKNMRCKYSGVSLKSDENGFVIEPAFLRGRYIFTRNNKEQQV